jgi:hypothetical protein
VLGIVDCSLWDSRPAVESSGGSWIPTGLGMGLCGPSPEVAAAPAALPILFN